ncbi:MAG: response regulator transcription factor [Deltaproteobacteria bacterium]
MLEKKVLVVEDENPIRRFININLVRNGFEVFEAESGEKALQIAKTVIPDVIILDIMLPGMSGFEACELLSKEFPNTAIIMLTAKTQGMDKVMGLELGADDYISKPFDPLELVARIRAILRRMNIQKPKENCVLIAGTLKIDCDAQKILKNDVILELTPKEYELIKLFIKNPDKVYSRDQLLDMVWGHDFFGDTKTVDVHIRRIRKKIEDDASDPKFIETVWGYGYRWRNNG